MLKRDWTTEGDLYGLLMAHCRWTLIVDKYSRLDVRLILPSSDTEYTSTSRI